MLAPLLATFAQDAALRFEALEQAAQSSDAGGIEAAAHAYKSGAGTVHASVLAAALANVESAARGGHLETIPDFIEQIRSEHHAVLRELEIILATK